MPLHGRVTVSRGGQLDQSAECRPRCGSGEQSVNNPVPNTKVQEALRGITWNVVNNRRTIFSRIPGTKRVPVRATDTENPRGQTPASTC
jgi:hypothetical protein